jgi:hypothetical protein
MTYPEAYASSRKQSGVCPPETVPAAVTHAVLLQTFSIELHKSTQRTFLKD